MFSRGGSMIATIASVPTFSPATGSGSEAPSSPNIWSFFHNSARSTFDGTNPNALLAKAKSWKIECHRDRAIQLHCLSNSNPRAFGVRWRAVATLRLVLNPGRKIRNVQDRVQCLITRPGKY